jgi:3-oxoacyl-[acyl-carrier protein] reductase
MSASTASTRLLEGKVAIVTGAARGIGKATASLLAAHGANVLLCDLDTQRLQAAPQEIGPQSAAFGADLTEGGVPEALIADALSRWGGLDIIINNAGYSLNGPLEQMSDDQWHRMLDVHATAPMAILRAAAPHLLQAAADDKAQGREVFRKVVNVASLAVLGSEGRANYAAAKAALVGLTLSLAKEWGPSRINLNVVCPGVVATRLILGAEPGDTLDLGGESVPVGQPKSVIDQLTAQVPFGRLGTPEDLAGSIFLLCTPWSNWITGQVLHVSGGQIYGM